MQNAKVSFGNGKVDPKNLSSAASSIEFQFFLLVSGYKVKTSHLTPTEKIETVG